MVATIRVGDVTLRNLSVKFGLQWTEEAAFFPEWHMALPAVSKEEEQQLDRIRAGYVHLVSQASLAEDAVKLTVVPPLLYLADFFLPPLSLQSEVAVQFSIADAELTIEGKIDILVLYDQLWLLVIEAKRAAASIEVGLPQLLAYMLANPTPALPVYGLITTGGSFVVLKLVQGGTTSRYALSRIFEMRNPGNDRYQVFAVLKQLKHLVLQGESGSKEV